MHLKAYQQFVILTDSILQLWKGISSNYFIFHLDACETNNRNMASTLENNLQERALACVRLANVAPCQMTPCHIAAKPEPGSTFAAELNYYTD